MLILVYIMSLGCAGAPPVLDPTLDNVQAYVFDPGCAMSGCHNAQTHAGSLDLSEGASYDALVGAPAVNSVAAQNGWVLVSPGEPERSFLLRKIEQPGVGEGAPMPNASTTIDPYYLDLVRAWIEQGAQR